MICDYDMENNELIEAVMLSIENELDRVMWNITQEEYDSPFQNTGNSFTELDTFKVRAYDWTWDYDESGGEPEPNFEWRDYKLWWYKRCGRGNYANRAISNDELNEMLKECLEALRLYEKEKDTY